MSSTIPDLLPAVKEWITELGILPGGIYYRLPANPTTAPFARISRTGGGPDRDAEVPVSTITCLVEVWGLANRDYEAVRTAVVALEQAAHAVNGPTAAGDSGVLILGANVLSASDNPDPDTGFPRYVAVLSASGRNA